jgi:hypothetical protein
MSDKEFLFWVLTGGGFVAAVIIIGLVAYIASLYFGWNR